MTARAPNINRSKVHEKMVQALCMDVLPGTDKSLFPTIREFLCFTALLGFSEGRKIPLDKSAGVEDVSYQQFERGDADDLIFALAVAETKSIDVLREGKEGQCAEVFEEYANGGMQIVDEWIKANPGLRADKALIVGLKGASYLPEDADEDFSIDKVSF
jgi:dnd system-associated protein 4